MLDRIQVKLLLPTAVIGLIFVVIAFLFGEGLGNNGTLVLILVMVLAQSTGSYFYSKLQLRDRLNKLQTFLDLVVSTEQAPEAPLKDQGSDELSHFTNQLSDFIVNLADVIKEIRGESEQLSQGSNQLATQMSESVESVNESTGQIEQIADSIHQVAETSGILSESAEQVSETTSRVMEILAQGTSSSNTSQVTIEAVTKEVNGMAQDLALLQEECSRIGTVLDVIRGIAEQTNLLALNAAIEAARAGEQGRGFAVVADEVRALAHRTQESTVEIQSMVEGLQDKSNNAVNAISRGQELTQESLAHSQEVVGALDQVGDAFADVDNLTSQIASGTDEQRLATASINEKVATVVGLSREITAGLSSVAEHAERQKHTSAEVDTTLNRICV
ncbi:methyl-accepting chemotaxis protein [Thalassotalea atypica]|uniref:methyl-accepting chemotaxis protein n=1 Tax=Thalassotalea atypica TaxID=2054316 RepID=UPI0025743E87|nr:methyl-accepting chemotaxis protein [Thalassotalea atypica]